MSFILTFLVYLTVHIRFFVAFHCIIIKICISLLQADVGCMFELHI